MKNILIIALSIFSPVLMAGKDFTGAYECGGNDLHTKEPFKLIIYFEKRGNAYDLNCEYENVTYLGTAFVDSKAKNLPALLVNPNNYKETTLIAFQPLSNGDLNAIWTYLGESTIANAICRKL